MPGPRRPRQMELTAASRAELGRLTRRPSAAAGLVRRGRIVRLAADGLPRRHSGPRVGVSRTVVRDWRDRLRAHGLHGLPDQPRPGRPRRFPP